MVNVELFDFINGFVGKSFLFDNLMVFVAKYFIILVPLFLIYLFLKKEQKSLFILLTLLGGVLFSKLIGFLFYSPRPFVFGLGTQLIGHVADASFPSDHATTFFVFGFSLLFSKYKKAGIGFLLLGGLVGFARIFGGIHFPLDVLGSLMVGFVVASLFYLFSRRNKF